MNNVEKINIKIEGKNNIHWNIDNSLKFLLNNIGIIFNSLKKYQKEYINIISHNVMPK